MEGWVGRGDVEGFFGVLGAVWVEGFALHGDPAAVEAAGFVGVDCVVGFLVEGGVEEIPRLWVLGGQLVGGRVVWIWDGWYSRV